MNFPLARLRSALVLGLFFLAQTSNVSADNIEDSSQSKASGIESQEEGAVDPSPVPYGSVWKYLDDGSNQGVLWRASDFDDSGWSSGLGQLGYGDGDESTVVAGNRITYYFRRSFVLDDAVGLASAKVDLLYDDAAIVYLNGEEVHRTDLLPIAEEVAYDEPAYGTLVGDNHVDEGVVVDSSRFVDGVNVLAVEVHNASASSSDISFDLNLELMELPEGSPRFLDDPIQALAASATHFYSGTLSEYATDPDGDSMVFTKVEGPDWLTVSPDGTFEGTPSEDDLGLATFRVSVTDEKDGTDQAALHVQVNDKNGDPPSSPNPSATEQVRLVWLDDPTSTVTVAWTQLSGAAATVKYGEVDHGRSESLYPNEKTVDLARTYTRTGSITTQFAGLTDLQPDTNYYFVLVDESGTSERYWFRTAPAEAQRFTFIVGGDSRNNRTPRQKANRMVAKLRPLFVAFTGDMINYDKAEEWDEWLSDWEQSTSADGRMYPLLPHRGNHEALGNSTLIALFNLPEGNYYALNFGGSLLRYYVLNSEAEESAQATWLQEDLDAAGGMQKFTHLMAGYHKPMRPHTTAKVEGSVEYSSWAQLFYDNRFDLVFESDSHVMKRTAPLRPDTGSDADEGFVTDFANGTVYTGEGCWGAPLRTTNDKKSWTLDAASFNGFDWVHVYPDYVELFTVQVDQEPISEALEEGDEFSLPAGIDLWHAEGGARLVVNRDGHKPISFAQYQLDSFGLMPLEGSHPAGDFDRDGKNNYTEYVFGTHANTADSPAQMEHFPHLVLGGSGEKILRHRQRVGITTKPEYWITENLTGWRKMEEGVDYTLTRVESEGFAEVELQMIGSNESLEKVFVRVGY